MTTVRSAVLGIALVLILGVPRVASAGAGDVIWGLSGPQLLGIVSGCDYVGTTATPVCRLIGKRVSGAAADDPFETTGPHKIWLTLDGTFYFSDGKDSEDVDYKAFNYYMVAFEPLVQVQSFHFARGMLYHGVAGLSYDILFGKGFDAFDNVAIKFRPIGISIGKIDVAYNLRIYPRGFTASDFGVFDPTPKSRPDAETVHGISFSWRW